MVGNASGSASKGTASVVFECCEMQCPKYYDLQRGAALRCERRTRRFRWFVVGELAFDNILRSAKESLKAIWRTRTVLFCMHTMIHSQVLERTMNLHTCVMGLA